MSSLAAVGPSEAGSPLNESAARRPITAYGRSKAAGEWALEQLRQLPSTVLRPPAVYGPGEQDLFALFRFVARGVAPRVGWRQRNYSFVYVDDLVAATLIAAATQTDRKRTFFVAPTGSETGIQFIKAIEAALGKTVWKPPIPSPFLFLPAMCGSLVTPFLRRPPLLNLDRWRDLVRTNWVCDAGSLFAEVGYTPPTSLVDGVRQTAEAARARGLIP